MNVSSIGGVDAVAQTLAGSNAGQAGSVQEQAQVSVLKKAMDTQSQLTLQVLESGLGGKLDVKG
jgi:hypothetical protein